MAESSPQSSSLVMPSVPAQTGSSDALELAEWARRDHPMVVFCARASEVSRLREEISWFDPALKVCVFPDWETLPYDSFSPHQDLVSERLATLYQMQRREFDVLVLPATTALQRLPPLEYLAAYTFFLKQGETLGLDALRAQLVFAGYQSVSQVMAPGEFCVRGGIIDLFPMGSVLPYRIDLMDETIEGIRTFDVDTQRTIYKVGEIRLLPAREYPTDDAGRNRFRNAFREHFEGDPSKSTIYRDVSNGVSPAGIEYWLPLFFEKTATLFDYLPPECKLVMQGDTHAALTDFWRDMQSRYRFLRGERDRPLLDPSDLFLDAEQFFLRAGSFERLRSDATHKENDAIPRFTSLPVLAVERRAEDPLHALKAFLDRYPGRVLLIAESAGRRETLIQYLNEYALRPADCDGYASFANTEAPLMLCVSPLLNGFVDTTSARALITEAELFAATARTRGARARERVTSVEGMLRDLSELRAGDPVVHLDHGIGRYRGLIDLDFGEGKTEFL
ncbi:MAG: CarD family transcriptional regulator, partial [Burkholderiales bacterium]